MADVRQPRVEKTGGFTGPVHALGLLECVDSVVSLFHLLQD